MVNFLGVLGKNEFLALLRCRPLYLYDTIFEEKNYIAVIHLSQKIKVANGFFQVIFFIPTYILFNIIFMSNRVLLANVDYTFLSI